MTSEAQSQEAEVCGTLWKQAIRDHKDALKDGLRKIAPTILKSLHEHKLIGDKDYDRLKNFQRVTVLDAILDTIENKDRQAFEVFRGILKHHRQTALYKLLDIENKGKPETGNGGKGDEGSYLKDLRDEMRANSMKMDNVMNAIKRVESNQAEEISRLRSFYEQKQEECNKLKENNFSLKSRIAELNRKLKQNQGSKEEVGKLENELRMKREELKKNGEIKNALEEEVVQLRSRLKDMEAMKESGFDSASDVLDI